MPKLIKFVYKHVSGIEIKDIVFFVQSNKKQHRHQMIRVDEIMMHHIAWYMLKDTPLLGPKSSHKSNGQFIWLKLLP